MKLVLASANEAKLQELVALLAPLGHELIAQSRLGVESPPETGVTFEDNALLKARHAARHAGLVALSDDSGIEVDVLGGRPGVHSARYAGEGATDVANLEKMLREMQDVPAQRRSARYRCVIAMVRSADDPNPLIARGSWAGSILDAPRGRGGFGYDPIFLPEGSERSAAQLTPEEKNAQSHRAKALRELVALLCRA